VQAARRRLSSSTSSSRDEQFKGATGLRRLVNASRNSIAGLRHALANEAAMRQEMFGCIVLTPIAVLLPVPAIERLLLVLSMLLVLLTEFINSAIEAAIDRISFERHPLSGQAKDLGSAAVAIALMMTGLSWLVIAGPVLLRWLAR
jgi:diacylglycerol kinase (ATP)